MANGIKDKRTLFSIRISCVQHLIYKLEIEFKTKKKIELILQS